MMQQLDPSKMEPTFYAETSLGKGQLQLHNITQTQRHAVTWSTSYKHLQRFFFCAFFMCMPTAVTLTSQSIIWCDEFVYKIHKQSNKDLDWL